MFDDEGLNPWDILIIINQVQLQRTPVVVTVPTGPQPPSATTTSYVNSSGIRLEVAPPVDTVIDMSSSNSAVLPTAGFSTHPKPTVVTTMHGESESEDKI
ncbi:hypothetical protein BGX24_011343 [Mortierella sp. AD032]|nr:hypothetical protein BGX24_011343 [Mortierella sp. AD032]